MPDRSSHSKVCTAVSKGCICVSDRKFSDKSRATKGPTSIESVKDTSRERLSVKLRGAEADMGVYLNGQSLSNVFH